MIEGSYDVDQMRRKWERYKILLAEPEGDGSMLGRFYIIARSGVHDILELLDVLAGALEMET